jgi:hypothetical protein
MSCLVIAAVPVEGAAVLAALPRAGEPPHCISKEATGLSVRLEGDGFVSLEPEFAAGMESPPSADTVLVLNETSGQRRRVYRASLAGASHLPAELVNEAELRLQWALEEEKEGGVEAAVRAVVCVLGWLAQGIAEAHADAEVGIHEWGCRFSVDRLRWQDE